MIVGVGTEAMPYTELSNQTSHLAVGPVYSDRSPVGLSNQTGHLWNLSSQTGHLWDCLIRPATCGTCLVRPVTCGTSSPGCCGQVVALQRWSGVCWYCLGQGRLAALGRWIIYTVTTATGTCAYVYIVASTYTQPHRCRTAVSCTMGWSGERFHSWEKTTNEIALHVLL